MPVGMETAGLSQGGEARERRGCVHFRLGRTEYLGEGRSNSINRRCRVYDEEQVEKRKRKK
jgi:hypothetical protein